MWWSDCGSEGSAYGTAATATAAAAAAPGTTEGWFSRWGSTYLLTQRNQKLGVQQ
jgi:hypothetical protein